MQRSTAPIAHRTVPRRGVHTASLALIALLSAAWVPGTGASHRECRTASSGDTVKRAAVTPKEQEAWPDSTLAAIARHEACTGMSQQMVRAAWGLPVTIQTSIGSGFEVDEYRYRGATLIFQNDSLAAFRAAAAS